MALLSPGEDPSRSLEIRSVPSIGTKHALETAEDRGVAIQEQIEEVIDVRDGWLARLKAGFDAGYYRTEAAVGLQTSFPWQNKHCNDCPFWTNGICGVRVEFQAARSHTCRYFEDVNHEAATGIIRERQGQGYRRWWEWYHANP